MAAIHIEHIQKMRCSRQKKSQPLDLYPGRVGLIEPVVSCRDPLGPGPSNSLNLLP